MIVALLVSGCANLPSTLGGQKTATIAPGGSARFPISLTQDSQTSFTLTVSAPGTVSGCIESSDGRRFGCVNDLSVGGNSAKLPAGDYALVLECSIISTCDLKYEISSKAVTLLRQLSLVSLVYEDAWCAETVTVVAHLENSGDAPLGGLLTVDPVNGNSTPDVAFPPIATGENLVVRSNVKIFDRCGEDDFYNLTVRIVPNEGPPIERLLSVNA